MAITAPFSPPRAPWPVPYTGGAASLQGFQMPYAGQDAFVRPSGSSPAQDLGRYYLDLGDRYYQANRFQEALGAFDEVVRQNPQDYVALNKRGVVKAAMKDYPGAMADYTQAIAIAPDYAMALENRGALYGKRGEADRAIADLTLAIAIAPGDAIAFYNRGKTYLDKGDDDRAIADLTQALTLKPDDPDALYDRSLAYAHKGDQQRAKADLDRYVTITVGRMLDSKG